ncbi:MAG: DUF11 domain-containing protein [Anaerolineae bacterium]|nr:DUF11 domain-containing protein [Anaerolineae bacterium]
MIDGKYGVSFFRWGLVLALVLGFLAAMPPRMARAGTIVVITDNDSGAGSLRAAIASAMSGDTIVFEGDYSIYLSSPLTITKHLTIDAGDRIIKLSGDTGNDGSRNVRIFSVAPDTMLTLSHLSVVSGTASNGLGGGIYSEGDLTLQDCVLSDNFASNAGGGVYNDGGVLIVQSSTFSNNHAGQGGGISNQNGGTVTITHSTFIANNASAHGAAIFNANILTLQNSTLTDNDAMTAGGGIYDSGGAVTLQNSTIAYNKAPSGSAIYQEGALTMTNCTLYRNWGDGLVVLGTLNYRNTLISSVGGMDCDADYGEIGDNIHNLVADGTCDPMFSGDPLLGPLADNGGDTQTLMPLPGSLAIEGGDADTCPATDQRGVTRPQGFVCDIGAVEAPAQPVLRVTKSVTPTMDVPYHGAVTYTLTLANIGAVSAPAASLTDTLPPQVDFGSWSENHGATVAGDAIAWDGSVSAGGRITFTFTASQTGDYGEIVPNTVYVSDGSQVFSDTAAFRVGCTPAYTVQNANDSGAGSLRQGIAGVCPGGTIDFAADAAIYLNSRLFITKSLTIDGSSHAIKVSGDSGNDGTRDVGVFEINYNRVVTLSHLSVVSGSLSNYSGAGIHNKGILTVLNSTIAGNGVGYGGGGIYNYGVLVMRNSTVADNYGGTEAGGLYNAGVLTITNSTFSGNRARYNGGGIVNNVGTAFLEFVTLSGNIADFDNTGSGKGGGISNGYGATMTLVSTIVVGNEAPGTPGNADCFSDALLISGGYNLLGQNTGCPSITSDITTTNPLLDILADNGGDTWTRALVAGSPAIDAVPPVSCTVATDQRGLARPFPVGGNCDIGAYEAAPTHNLTIAVAGDGSGVVSPTVGSHVYPSGTIITLTATPASNSLFSGWSGDAGCAAGQVTMDADRVCTATFTLAEAQYFIYLPLVVRH